VVVHCDFRQIPEPQPQPLERQPILYLGRRRIVIECPGYDRRQQHSDEVCIRIRCTSPCTTLKCRPKGAELSHDANVAYRKARSLIVIEHAHNSQKLDEALL
jgi:hypothetical protein